MRESSPFRAGRFKTTFALALAAIALLTGVFALLASRLLTVMLIGFGLLVWLPAPFSDPHKLINWAGNAQNLAITGAAWIVADYLFGKRSPAMPRTLLIATPLTKKNDTDRESRFILPR